jgi:hypothetical protein
MRIKKGRKEKHRRRNDKIHTACDFTTVLAINSSSLSWQFLLTIIFLSEDVFERYLPGMRYSSFHPPNV